MFSNGLNWSTCMSSAENKGNREVSSPLSYCQGSVQLESTSSGGCWHTHEDSRFQPLTQVFTLSALAVA